MHPGRRFVLSCVLFAGLGSIIPARADSVYVAGQTYFGRNEYIEYHAGNLPFIFSAPHGGTLTPAEIPDRTWGTTGRDTNTDEVARAFINAVVARTGGHPHVIICRLHRLKLDANRDSVEAAQGNPFALQAWQEYHRFIEAASDTVVSQWGKGLYVDLHGHAHTIQRLELGYLLSASQLALSNNVLDNPSLAATTSIATLAGSSPEKLSGLLRGPRSLGAFFENRGYPAVPSATQHDPGSDPYFSGGYNTERHGSRWGGTIDGIQIESYYAGVRDNTVNINRYAATIAEVFEYYTNLHHFGQTVTPADLTINEVLFDLPPDDAGTPAIEGDANGDGVRSVRGDEFVELVNRGATTVSLAGYRLLERDMRTIFTFPDTARLEPGQYAVVFGGVGPAGFGGSLPPGARYFAAKPGLADSGFYVSGSKTNLLNAGDNLVLLEPRSNTVLGEICWGSASPRTISGAKLIAPNTLLGDSITGPIAQAVTRSPDVTGLWVKALDLPPGTEPYTPGRSAVTSVATRGNGEVPDRFALGQNYPNPFNPETRVPFTVPAHTHVRIVVYDLLGREIVTLLDRTMEQGSHEVSFRAGELPAGVYFYAMKTQSWSATQKMILLR